MFRPDEFIRDVETHYPVNTVTVGGEQIWPFLRMPYAFQKSTGGFAERGERKAYDLDFSDRRHKPVRSALYRPYDWLRRYEYIAIGVGHDRRLINGVRFNRFLDPIIDELGQDKVLFIEQPTPVHEGNEHTKHVVSEALLVGIRQILTKVDNKPHIDNAHVLLDIQRAYGLKMNDVTKVRNFLVLQSIFATLFRLVKPKALILTNYYGFAHPALKAAHAIGIKVVEVQHGTISKAHPAYNAYTDLDSSYFADYLLMFGRRELALFANSGVIDPSRVVPVGSFYLDHIRKTFSPDPQLQFLLQPFSKSVAVGLQLGFEKAMVQFVNSAARLDRDICYCLMPRIADNYFADIELETNVMFYTAHNMFEVLPQFDFHVTVSSTTAIEAPSLGARDIIVDMEGEGRRHIWSQQPESEIARYVLTPQEMVDAINNYPPISRDRVMALNQENIEPNYLANIKQFVGQAL